MPLVVVAGPGSRHYVASGGGGGGDNLFVADFSDKDANGSNFYNFDNRYTPGTNWTHTHLASGGHGGGAAAQVTLLASQEQYNVGWQTPSLSGWSPSVGDSIYFRFTVKFGNSVRWPATTENGKQKFLLFGTTGTPQSRVIVYTQPPLDVNGALGMKDYGNYLGGGEGVVPTQARPTNFGLTGSNDWSNVETTGDQYGSFQQLLNIEGWPHLNFPALVSYGNKSSPPIPGPNSAASTDGWYHIQMQAKSGTSGNVEFRTWINNDTQGSPTASRTGITGTGDGMGVVGWTGAVEVCGYVDNAPSSNLDFILSRFEVGRSFRSDWYSSR